MGQRDIHIIKMVLSHLLDGEIRFYQSILSQYLNYSGMTLSPDVVRSNEETKHHIEMLKKLKQTLIGEGD
ncbi:hypothetical protein KKE60_06105 [Patescibacteria group bacterium]|nr:hypothetical protein [Patescibacteria group bacterium]